MSLEGLHCSCSLLIWKRCLSSQAVCCLCTLAGSFLVDCNCVEEKIGTMTKVG